MILRRYHKKEVKGNAEAEQRNTKGQEIEKKSAEKKSTEKKSTKKKKK